MSLESTIDSYIKSIVLTPSFIKNDFEDNESERNYIYKNEAKYPVEKSRGNCKKYNEL